MKLTIVYPEGREFHPGKSTEMWPDLNLHTALVYVERAMLRVSDGIHKVEITWEP